jgi:NADP-dependent 3-hydroxy acid dehydrogenase YdfG
MAPYPVELRVHLKPWTIEGPCDRPGPIEETTTSDILNGKVVVVTGASSGIGRAIAIGAARHGAKAVIVSDVTETLREGGGPTAAEIEELGVAARFHRTDVSKQSENDALVEVP